jgi:hypothetical protein
MNTDTPLPQDEPAGKNPPDGAMIDFYLPAPAARVIVELVDGGGATVRRFGSDDPLPAVKPESLTVMPEWARPPQPVPIGKGSHRFIWDLRRPPPAPDGQGRRGGGLPISAIWRDTPFSPLGDWVEPGKYTVRLTVDGTALEQPLEVRADPRRK